MLTLLPTPALRLLLVEADAAVSDALQRSLRRAGWDVLPAQTARAALHLKMVYAPDLVLVSLGLPDMDGRRLVSWLTGLADCAVVAMSGLGDDAGRTVLEHGALDYLAKPLGMRDMLTRLQDAVTRQKSGAGAPRLAQAAGGIREDAPDTGLEAAGDTACATVQRNGH